MLLCRTTLGDCMIEHKFRGNNPGQYWCVDAIIIFSALSSQPTQRTRCRYQRRREPDKPGGGVYNAVVGEGRSNSPQATLEFREYIIYEGKQVYPEYHRRRVTRRPVPTRRSGLIEIERYVAGAGTKYTSSAASEAALLDGHAIELAVGLHRE